MEISHSSGKTARFVCHLLHKGNSNSLTEKTFFVTHWELNKGKIKNLKKTKRKSSPKQFKQKI